MIYLMQRTGGHYCIEGVGYSTIRAVLDGQLDAAAFLLLLFVAKLLATSIGAMVGMGAMVGSSTGAAMTAITMIFGMTRDCDVVLPMVIAVAVALGTRRLLSAKTIYTMKPVRRGNPIPKALHANTMQNCIGSRRKRMWQSAPTRHTIDRSGPSWDVGSCPFVMPHPAR